MRTLFLVFSFVFLTTCSDNSTTNPNCRYLLDVGVNVTINLSLPQYSQLEFPGNSVYVSNAGNGGIIVTNAGSGFFAWDASDPNKTPSSCSILKIIGLSAISDCVDRNSYSLVNGQPLGNYNENNNDEPYTPNPNLVCGLKNYRIEQSGNTLLV